MDQILLESLSRRMEDWELRRGSQHGFIQGKLCLTKPVAFYDGAAALVDKSN